MLCSKPNIHVAECEFTLNYWNNTKFEQHLATHSSFWLSRAETRQHCVNYGILIVKESVSFGMNRVSCLSSCWGSSVSVRLNAEVDFTFCTSKAFYSGFSDVICNIRRTWTQRRPSSSCQDTGTWTTLAFFTGVFCVTPHSCAMSSSMKAFWVMLSCFTSSLWRM